MIGFGRGSQVFEYLNFGYKIKIHLLKSEFKLKYFFLVKAWVTIYVILKLVGKFCITLKSITRKLFGNRQLTVTIS